jgi:phosphoserine phosphatase RsbU/P
MTEVSGGHLLVVDDNPVNRKVLGRYLEQLGHTIRYAENGRQALEMLAAGTHFDMMLLDIEMPEMNGYQVLEQMTADASLRDLPVIVTSALDELDSVVKCIEMGAEDYLIKPVNQVLLKARIGASLEKKRLRDRQSELINRLEREMEIARKTQESILPEQLPGYPGYDFGALMVPARSVGGDFYEFIPLSEEKLGIVIGDVSDKGLPAALFMALTYSLVRAEAVRCDTPGEALLNANRHLRHMNASGQFVTLLYGILDLAAGEFRYARAGHLMPVVMDQERKPVKMVMQPGQPLGIFDTPLIDEARLTIPPGGTLFIFSDGLTEPEDAQSRQFGSGGLLQVCSSFPDSPAQELCQQAWQAVRRHSGDSLQQDDFTIVAIKKLQERHA